MAKGKVVRGRPHPHPAVPGTPSPTGEGEWTSGIADTLDEWHTAPLRSWQQLSPDARRMRAAPTPAEEALWQAVRNGALGARFRRQHPVDRFIADFVCMNAKLIVEVDGGSHAGRQPEDSERDARLRSAGFRVLRFPNARVLEDLPRVITEIRTALGRPD